MTPSLELMAGYGRRAPKEVEDLVPGDLFAAAHKPGAYSRTCKFVRRADGLTYDSSATGMPMVSRRIEGLMLDLWCGDFRTSVGGVYELRRGFQSPVRRSRRWRPAARGHLGESQGRPIVCV